MIHKAHKLSHTQYAYREDRSNDSGWAGAGAGAGVGCKSVKSITIATSLENDPHAPALH